MFSRWHIQSQLLLLVGLLLAPLCALLAYNVYERAQTGRLEHEANVQRIARLLVARVDQVAVDSGDLLSVMSRLPVLQQLQPNSCATVGQALDFGANVYANALIWDGQGKLLCQALPETQLELQAVASAPWFQHAWAAAGLTVTDPIEVSAGDWHLLFIHPIFSPTGQTIALLALPVDLRALHQRSLVQESPDELVWTVLNERGRILLRWPQPERWVGRDVTGQPLAEFSDASPGSVSLLTGIDGVRRLYATQLIRSHGWQVHVGVPPSALMGPVDQQLRRGLWVSALIALVAILVSLTIARRILLPLHRLLANLRSGAVETDLLDATGPPEVRDLAEQLVAALLAQRAAEQQTALLSNLIEHSSEALLLTDQDNRIIAVNQAFESMTGYAKADAVGQDPRLFSSGRHSAEFFRALWQSLDEHGHWQGEIWNRRKSGELFPTVQAITRLRDDKGKVCYAALMLDISRQHEIEQELERLTFHDALTGLANRSQFAARLESAIVRHQHMQGRHLALLQLGIDGFKLINDTLGHPVGDELLVQVANRLLGVFRHGELVCRIGGDEFAILVEALPQTEALLPIIAQIEDAMHESFTLKGREISVSLSLGISMFPDHARRAIDLVSYADAALGQAKQSGRGRFAFYSQEMSQQTTERMALEQDLRRAIERGQLSLVYQPQVSLADARLVGAEALLRWQHAEGGFISPALFIPIAEEIGLMDELSRWVMSTSCAQLHEWQAQGVLLPQLAINLSGSALLGEHVVELLRRQLQQYDLTGERVELEITESSLIADPKRASALIQRLQAMGCRVAIDDFGTGYSSLSYLKHFRADVLKIDRSFVTGVDRDQSNQSIARAVIAVGHALQMKVLAEGVERVEELHWLRAAGCDLIQGYYLSRPLAAAQLAQFVADWQPEQWRLQALALTAKAASGG